MLINNDIKACRLSDAESGRPITNKDPKDPKAPPPSKVLRLDITTGFDIPLTGKCVFFLRDKRDEINMSNMAVSRISYSCTAPTIFYNLMVGAVEVKEQRFSDHCILEK